VNFVIDKEQSTVEWINWWCKCFSLSSLEECECLPEFARPAWGGVDIWLSPTYSMNLKN